MTNPRPTHACDLYVVCARCADNFHPCKYSDECSALVAVDEYMACMCKTPVPDTGDWDWDGLQLACPKCERPEDYPDRDGKPPASITDLVMVAALETGGHCYQCKTHIVPVYDATDDLDWTMVPDGTTVLLRRTNSCVHWQQYETRCTTCWKYIREEGTACCSSNYPVPRVPRPVDPNQPLITAFMDSGRA